MWGACCISGVPDPASSSWGGLSSGSPRCRSPMLTAHQHFPGAVWAEMASHLYSLCSVSKMVPALPSGTEAWLLPVEMGAGKYRGQGDGKWDGRGKGEGSGWRHRELRQWYEGLGGIVHGWRGAGRGSWLQGIEWWGLAVVCPFGGTKVAS